MHQHINLGIKQNLALTEIRILLLQDLYKYLFIKQIYKNNSNCSNKLPQLF
jgi:hypothetical protein